MANNDGSRPPLAPSKIEGPELGRTDLPSVVFKGVNTDYPLIDYDPHFKRVIRYARPSDYYLGTAVGAIAPGGMLLMERFSPSGASKQAFASIMRLNFVGGAIGGFLFFYARSISRFYGFRENRREIEMDMREMVDKVKKGEPLYGASTLSAAMQNAAHRQSRYTGIFLHVIPWFNFVNHPHHGVDTSKYYRQAELELSQEGK